MSAARQCFNCERGEGVIPLIAGRFQGRDLWICSDCLPVLIHKRHLILEQWTLPANEAPGEAMDYIKGVERVALAVDDLDQAQAFFEQWFGAKFHPEEHIADMGIRYRPFDIGASKMELLCATRADSPVAKFLKQNGGPGVHHITYEVEDLDAAIAELERRGGRIAYRHTYAPGVAFEGQFWREAFIHPRDAFGVLIHLAEKKPAT